MNNDMVDDQVKKLLANNKMSRNEQAKYYFPNEKFIKAVKELVEESKVALHNERMRESQPESRPIDTNLNEKIDNVQDFLRRFES